ncbi:AAA family ATPase [Archangium minus]|uniref:AAA family ATPase n=1 Tax=Archangium minus TaxID=83450 RepID=A0ABY9WL67_9BACT|nr:AAA family ATPase [Archangium minus]
MRFTRIRLKNWRNFVDVDVDLQERMFLVGPNASGKSNFLDAFRFLRDIAESQGGFQRAVSERQGVSRIRSLAARVDPNVLIEVDMLSAEGESWSYLLEFNQDTQRRPIVRREIVRRGDEVVLERPDKEDRSDRSRLTQTHLEQVNANKRFRALAEFFSQIRYLHIVPQLVREPERSVGHKRDPYGGDFLEQLATTPQKTLDSRLRRIKDALKVAVPQLEDLKMERDQKGVPHLKGLYRHWRPNAGWQTEDQFSDGTLRLLGLLWAMLDGSGPLLLEEPELSLHVSVARYLPRIMARINRKQGRQMLVSTHSADLLMDPGIGMNEVLLLFPMKEGTKIREARKVKEIRPLLEGGLPMGEVVLPHTAPRDADQLALFGE